MSRRTHEMGGLAAICAIALLAGCDSSGGGDDGGDGDGDNQEGGGNTAYFGPNCDHEPTDVALGEVTSIGFSANDVLAFAAGTHATTITWHPSEFATYGPEMGEHGLTIEVTATGDARLMTPAEDDGGDGSGEEGSDAVFGGYDECAEYLEIDVELRLTSDGGALDELWTETLSVERDDLATAFFHPDPTALGGAFEITDVQQAGFELSQLDVDLAFSPHGLGGSLGAIFEMQIVGGVGGGAVGVGGGPPLASIGAGACQGGLPVDVDTDIDGVSVQGALDLVTTVPTLDVVWDDASTSTATVTFELEGDGACMPVEQQGPYTSQAPPEEGALLMRGSLQLVSADGRLEADWPSEVWIVGGDTGVASVQMLPDSLRGLYADTPEGYGIHDVPYDANAYEGFFFDFELTLTAGDPAAVPSGSITLGGYPPAMCDEPEPIPNDGMGGAGSPGSGSGGCEGSMAVDLASAEFRAAQ